MEIGMFNFWSVITYLFVQRCMKLTLVEGGKMEKVRAGEKSNTANLVNSFTYLAQEYVVFYIFSLYYERNGQMPILPTYISTLEF